MKMRYISVLLGAVMMLAGGCFGGPQVDTTIALQRELRHRNDVIEEKDAEIAKQDEQLKQRDEVISDMVAQVDKLREELGKAPIVKKEIVTPKINDKDITVQRRGNDIVITVAGDVLFAKARWNLSPNSRKVLNKVVAVLKKDYPDRMLRIAGHTDSDPVRPSRKGGLKDNTELSFRRADAVLKYIQARGWPAKKMYIAAYGETRPRVPDTTKANKALNRRVEIIVLPEIKVREKSIEVSSK